MHLAAEPGRGWVKVRSKFLTPENIVRALENGEFYSSNGVTIQSIHMDSEQYVVEVKPEEGMFVPFVRLKTSEVENSLQRVGMHNDSKSK